jgi:hypothetical protein
MSDAERAIGPDLVLGLALAIARLHTDKSVAAAIAKATRKRAGLGRPIQNSVTRCT